MLCTICMMRVHQCFRRMELSAVSKETYTSVKRDLLRVHQCFRRMELSAKFWIFCSETLVDFFFFLKHWWTSEGWSSPQNPPHNLRHSPYVLRRALDGSGDARRPGMLALAPARAHTHTHTPARAHTHTFTLSLSSLSLLFFSPCIIDISGVGLRV